MFYAWPARDHRNHLADSLVFAPPPPPPMNTLYRAADRLEHGVSGLSRPCKPWGSTRVQHQTCRVGHTHEPSPQPVTGTGFTRPCSVHSATPACLPTGPCTASWPSSSLLPGPGWRPAASSPASRVSPCCACPALFASIRGGAPAAQVQRWLGMLVADCLAARWAHSAAAPREPAPADGPALLAPVVAVCGVVFASVASASDLMQDFRTG